MGAATRRLVAIVGCYLCLFWAIAVAFVAVRRGVSALQQGRGLWGALKSAFPSEPVAAALILGGCVLVVAASSFVFRSAAMRIGSSGAARRASWAAYVSGSMLGLGILMFVLQRAWPQA